VIDVLGWLGYSQIYYFALIFKLIVFLITDIGSHYLSVNRVMKFDAISDDYFFFLAGSFGGFIECAIFIDV